MKKFEDTFSAETLVLEMLEKPGKAQIIDQFATADTGVISDAKDMFGPSLGQPVVWRYRSKTERDWIYHDAKLPPTDGAWQDEGIEEQALSPVVAVDLHDAITHRATWREALEIARDLSATPDDRSYYKHELEVFDALFDKLAALVPEGAK